MTEVAATPGITFVLPQCLVDANLRANRVYPQNNTGLTMQAGYVAYRLLIDGQVTPDQLFGCAATPVQQEEMLQAAIAAHRGNGIPCALVDKNKRDFGDPHQFTVERIGALSTGWLTIVQSQIAHFAGDTIPEIGPMPYNILSLVGKKSLDVVVAEKSAVTMFFQRGGQEPRPEVLALDGLWRAGHDILAEPPALDIARRARGLMSQLLRPETTLDEWAALETELKVEGTQLKGLVAAQVLAAVPSVSEHTGVPVRQTTVETFLGQGLTGFRIRMPKRLVEEKARRGRS